MAATRVDSMDSKGMQFAKQQLEKFGWKEGSGLGRNKNGITTALKPKLKFDSTGLGHKQSEDLVYEWWNHAFNKAAQSFDVQTSEEGVVVVRNGGVGKISNRKQVRVDTDQRNSYGSFHKAGTLMSGGMIEEKKSVSIVEEKDFSIKLSDEELFKLCGGRTAHKGARHGHRCKGKLARVAEQEALLLAKLNQTENSNKGLTGPAGEQIKKPVCDIQSKENSNLPLESLDKIEEENETIPVGKKKKKKRDKEVNHVELEPKLKRKKRVEMLEEGLPEEESPVKDKKSKKKKKQESVEETSQGTPSEARSEVVELDTISECRKQKKKRKKHCKDAIDD